MILMAKTFFKNINSLLQLGTAEQSTRAIGLIKIRIQCDGGK